MNSFAYVSGNPILFIDPIGQVKWTGSVTGGAFLTAGIFYFELESECVNGKRGHASVILSGPGLGFGAIDFSFSSSSVEMNDSLSFVEPNVFNDTSLDGGFLASAAFSIPPTPEQRLGQILGGGSGNEANGYGCSAIRLGEAGGTGCGPMKGLDISVGAFLGSSTVTNSSVEDCGCKK